MCGTAPWEWEADRFAYMPVRQVCLGCQAKDLMRTEEEHAPPGSSVTLLPRPVADRLLAEQAEVEARRARRREAQS